MKNTPKKIKAIYISNILEGYYQSYQSLPEKERKFWTTFDYLDGNRALLYDGDNKVVVTSYAIHQGNFEEIRKVMGWKNVSNLFPESPTFSLNQDCINDKKLNGELLGIIRANPGIALIPYRSTPYFQKLIVYLKKQGLRFTTPETIESDKAFILDYFHSKRGFRHLWHQANHMNKLMVSIPEGFITGDKEEAIEAAWWFKTQQASFVIKYNRGTQGIGLFIVNEKDYSPDKQTFVSQIKMLLGDKIWDEPVIVVERLEQPTGQGEITSPSIEFFIDPKGKVHPTYACDQIFADDKKTFRGIYIYPGLINNSLIRRAFHSGMHFGKELAKYGYRGVFDIDLIKIDNRKIYAVESNLRRTGGTHLHEACLSLLGKDYGKKYHVVIEDFELKKNAKLDYEVCNKIFAPFIFDKKKKRGLLLFNPDMLKVGILNIALVARSRQAMASMRASIKELLRPYVEKG